MASLPLPEPSSSLCLQIFFWCSKYFCIPVLALLLFSSHDACSLLIFLLLTVQGTLMPVYAAC
jgi:hypothetical protein